MGEKNSSVTRSGRFSLELVCGERDSTQSLRLLLDLAFKNSGNVLAAEMRDTAGAVLPSLIEKPLVPRTEYGLKVIPSKLLRVFDPAYGTAPPVDDRIDRRVMQAEKRLGHNESERRSQRRSVWKG